MNVEAWLKKPELGMIPLFMAGDKAFTIMQAIKKRNWHQIGFFLYR